MSDFAIFSVLGIEIEYMLVNKDSLNVQPKSDVLLSQLAGTMANEVILGDVAVSNELMLHVLEFKNNGPKPFNAPIRAQFQQAIADILPLLNQFDLALLPTGAHPWMNPNLEAHRWPHDHYEIYQQYDAVFNCSGHGWANLQSMHVNLPYANQKEFAHLHQLIRLIIPLLPALAASTPFLDGKRTAYLDSRLHYYCHNQEKIPSISGDIIPECIYSEQEYKDAILTPMYEDIRPFDPQGILQHEWLNSRGAIPKFNQKSIEIRVLDTQECVAADIALAKTIFMVLKHWYEQDRQWAYSYDTKQLKHVLLEAIKQGMDTPISNSTLCRLWGVPLTCKTIKDVWTCLIEEVSSALDAYEQNILELILTHGNLSERLIRATQKNRSREALTGLYQQLSHCLLSNEPFIS